MWLTCVKDIRNKISHTPSTTHYEQVRLDKWWTMLEGAVLGLASKVSLVQYEESIKEYIDLLKNSDPTASQLSDITDHIRAENAKFQDQLLHQQNNIVDNLKEDITHMLQQHKDEIAVEMKNLIINVKLNDVPSQTDQLSSTEVSSTEHQAAHPSRMHIDQSSLEVFPKDSAGINTEDTCDFKEGDDGVQCPLCHNRLCCKLCEENREMIKCLEKHNRKLKNDVESMFDEPSEAKDFSVLEPSSKRIKLETDVGTFKAGDREKKTDRKEVDEDAECDVCKTTDSEEKNEMVFCDGCNVCVHQACYGIRRIPRGRWYCKPCSENVKPKCVLCHNTGGAMKKTSDDTTWAYVVCALWIREVKIENTKDMGPILDMEKIPYSRWALT
ncbi:JADE1 [Mytilus coruscus]|uniref:JADE1 n=1 Tax=Mytilus coruscus TaxID=42192 RepID=A0A6J8APN9_MYTCO|nr:JADE1 [Mytilus coruscus]